MEYTCRQCGEVIPVDLKKLEISPRVQCPRCGQVCRLRKRSVRESSDAPVGVPLTHYRPPVPVPSTRAGKVVTIVSGQPERLLIPAESAPRRRPSLAVLVACGLAVVGCSGWFWLWTALRPAPTRRAALKPVVGAPREEPTIASRVAEALPVEAPLVSALDRRRWMSADFVLVNAPHFAVAMKEMDSPGRFQVLAKAEQHEAHQAMKTSWEAAVPIVAEDPKLARSVFAGTEVNQDVRLSLTPELQVHWRHHSFVPPETTLVAFNDLSRGARRVGFRRNGAGLEFRELLGTKFEHIPLELVQPGTLESDLDEEQLAVATDYLDVCLYHICRRLESPGQRSSYLQVVVCPVMCEGEGLEHLEAQISELNLSLDGLRDARAAIERQARQKGQEEERPDLGQRQRELEARKHELETRRELVIEARRLTGEIRAKLSQIGVPLLERTVAGLAAIGRERTGFTRPDFETAESTQLLGATHLLLTDIRPPARRGRYELSLRCVSVASGKLLWDGQGDRLDTTDTALDLAGSPYLLNSGRLSVVSAASGYRASDAILPLVKPAGWSLLGPAMELVPVPKTDPTEKPRRSSRQREAPPRPWTWLGYVESGVTEARESLVFRDLFRKESQHVPSDWVGNVLPVDSLTQVPEEHRLSYVVWRLARSILPLAGRVTLIGEGRQVEVGLRDQDGVRVGDRLVVLRPTALAGGGGTMDVPLPVELILTAIHEKRSRAYWDSGGEAELRDNDIVHRKLKRKPMVALMELTPDLRNVPPGQLAQIMREIGNTEPELLQFTEFVSKRLTNLLQAAFLNLQVPVVEREDLDKLAAEQRLDDVDSEKAVEIGRLIGATHLVLGRLSPGLNDTTAVSMRVVSADTGQVIEQIDFGFTRAQMDGWSP